MLKMRELAESPFPGSGAGLLTAHEASRTPGVVLSRAKLIRPVFEEAGPLEAAPGANSEVLETAYLGHCTSPIT